MRDGIVRRQTSRFPKDHRVSLAVAVIGTAIGILLRLPVGAQAPEQVRQSWNSLIVWRPLLKHWKTTCRTCQVNCW